MGALPTKIVTIDSCIDCKHHEFDGDDDLCNHDPARPQLLPCRELNHDAADVRVVLPIPEWYCPLP